MGKKRHKNCHNCIHLEWVDVDYLYNDPSGFVCNAREYKTDAQETAHLARLEDGAYLDAPKKCCALRDL